MRLSIVEAMSQGPAVRLVFIKAPAGAGKTTLMIQARSRWRDEGNATAWLTLDAADNDTSRFIACLDVVIDELYGDEVDAGEERDQRSAGEMAVAAMERVAAIDFPFVLFLDEFEALRSQDVLSLVQELVGRLPRGGKLVIGSRTDSLLPLAKLRVAAQLLEIDSRALRFSIEETHGFFERRAPLGLTAAELTALHAKTDGWAAAVWLAWLALERSKDRSRFIQQFSGSEAALAGYLAEEVLSKQPLPVREFLLKTSILGELSATLCQAMVPEVDAGTMLHQLASDGLFLIPIENEPDTWKYHSLFADFLRAELAVSADASMPSLHKFAADAYRALGRPVKAIDHLILGGHDREAVALLGEQAPGLLNQGRLRLLARWFDKLPAHALERTPMLQVVRAWTMSYTKGPRMAQSLLDSAQRAVADSEVGAQLAALQVTLLNQLDRWEEAYAVGSEALRMIGSGTQPIDTALINVVASSAAVLGLFTEAKRLVGVSRRSQAQSNSPFQRMYGESVEGIVDLVGGRFRQAQARFRLALQASHEGRSGAPHGNAWAGLLYAASIYERGEIRESRQLLQVYVPLCREAWLSDHTIIGYQLLARIAFHNGDVEKSFELISILELLGHERHLPRFVGAAMLERAYILLRQGHAQASAEEMDRAVEQGIWQDIESRRHLAHDCDDIEIGRLRWEVHFGNASVAALRLKEAAQRASRQGRCRRRLKLDLLTALAHWVGGDSVAAITAAHALLREMFREGAARLLLDEGAAVAVLVDRVQASVNAMDDVLFFDYLHGLRAGFSAFDRYREIAPPSAPGGALLEPLTAKEVQVVELLSEGYSNRALSDRLFVSMSTVCTHLRNINAKLGTHSRTQAVATCRRHGIIH